LEAVADVAFLNKNTPSVAFLNKNTPSVKLVYQDPPLEEDSRSSQITFKKA
jgi:hypothetical protein